LQITRARLSAGQGMLVAFAVVLAAGTLAVAVQPAEAETAPAAPPSVFGADVRDYQVDSLVVEPCPGQAESCAKGAGLNWVRQNIGWTDLQPRPPKAGYTSQPAACPEADGWCYWDQAYVEAAKARLKKVTDRGHTPIVILQWVPDWVNGGKPAKHCYLPSEQFDAYAALAANVVREFKAAGIPVRHWQVWNEPEPTMEEMGAGCGTLGIGSFGDAKDEYYGGARFTDLLAKATPAIKAADPEATVVAGGLMLACNDCPAQKFLRGMLDHHGKRDGAQFFDVLDYHAYPGWSGNAQPDREWSLTGWNEHSSGRGYIFDKLRFVRGVMAEYGAADKPVLLGETGLTCAAAADGTRPCPEMGADAGFTAAQANMVVRTYTRAIHAGLLGVEWYSFGDGLFEQSELIDVDHGTQKVTGLRPGYTAMRFLAGELGGATLLRDESTRPRLSASRARRRSAPRASPTRASTPRRTPSARARRRSGCCGPTSGAARSSPVRSTPGRSRSTCSATGVTGPATRSGSSPRSCATSVPPRVAGPSPSRPRRRPPPQPPPRCRWRRRPRQCPRSRPPLPPDLSPAGRAGTSHSPGPGAPSRSSRRRCAWSCWVRPPS
jgi:hypothetical protein